MAHWRQPRRGCRGHIPQCFGWGDVNGNTPRQYYYVLSDIADQYWLPSVRSASSRFHSAVRRHRFASVRQAGGQSPFGGSSPQPRTRVDATALAPLTEILRTFLVKDCPRADFPALPRAQFSGRCCCCCCCTWQISACQLVSDASIPWDAQ